jgi:LmbE family N-acetylglucosaminyl deacetylase
VQEDYQHVYFSPHLDDVVLSCAGRIARQTAAGDRVLVVTIFAGSRGDAVPAPHARSLDWAPFQDLAARRREDRRALQALAADHRWLDYPDAIQRHRRYASVTGITAPLPRREAALRAQVGASIADVGRRCPAATLYFPLGIGNHVDHQLVSAAGLDRRQVNSPQARGLLFYEDTPYVCIPHLLRQRFEQLGIRAPSGSPPPVLARARETHAALLAAPQLIVQRDARWFDEPLEFRPDRWTTEFRENLPRFAYYPFGGGPRQCIGEGFAMMEAKLILATLGQRWRVHHDPRHKIEMLPLISLRPKGGMPMHLERRG